MSTYIPIELIQLIIEQLADSRTSLHACALVCKAWVPAAFRILFHSFSLNTNQSNKFHPGLSFPHYVSRLNITASRPERFVGLEAALFLFDHAYAICIHVLDSTRFVPYICYAFPHLRDLDLSVISFPDPRSIRVLVAAFPDLERLSVGYTYPRDGLGGPDSYQPDDLPPPPNLRALVYNISDIHRIPFLDWLSTHPLALERLSLYELAPIELQPAGAFLRTLGPHLRTLNLSFTGRAAPTQISNLASLINTHLHTLHISLFYTSLTSNLYIPLALLNSNNPALRCVTLVLSPGHSFEGQEWGPLDNVLTLRAPALECLHIYMYGHIIDTHFPDRRGLQSLIKERMPLCSQRGTLAGIDVVDKSVDIKPPIHRPLSTL